MTIDRETIGAFVDGELSEIERRRVEAALAGNPVLAQQVEAQRRLRALLKARFDPLIEQAVPQHLIEAVHDGATVVPLRRRVSWGAPHWAAIAATLVVGVIAGQAFRPASDLVGRGGEMVASGGLERALETQLASAQPADAAVRIGLTFKAQDGAWCRTFEQKAMAGIACRSGAGWTLRRSESLGGQAGEYRQAGSSEIAAAAQAMAADTPLDSDQERAAVAARWK